MIRFEDGVAQEEREGAGAEKRQEDLKGSVYKGATGKQDVDHSVLGSTSSSPGLPKTSRRDGGTQERDWITIRRRRGNIQVCLCLVTIGKIQVGEREEPTHS